jgi:hypothetical protein
MDKPAIAQLRLLRFATPLRSTPLRCVISSVLVASRTARALMFLAAIVAFVVLVRALSFRLPAMELLWLVMLALVIGAFLVCLQLSSRQRCGCLCADSATTINYNHNHHHHHHYHRYNCCKAWSIGANDVANSVCSALVYSFDHRRDRRSVVANTFSLFACISFCCGRSIVNDFWRLLCVVVCSLVLRLDREPSVCDKPSSLRPSLSFLALHC